MTLGSGGCEGRQLFPNFPLKVCHLAAYTTILATDGDILLIPYSENLERIQGKQAGFPSAKMKKPEFCPPDWKIKRCLSAQIAFPLLCAKLGLTIFKYHFETGRN